MFERDFLENCIILQFLTVEKLGKALNAEAQSSLRKDSRKIGGVGEWREDERCS
jgi:hypothetical protein